MIRTSMTEWRGNGPDGKGSLSTESGALQAVPYSFETRFEDGTAATNPEELLGAAHASLTARLA